jgi:hypothetical protein
MKNKQILAMLKRVKAAVNAPTLSPTIRPAIKVPPQMNAIMVNCK